MALIEQTLFGTVNKVDQAIQRIKMYDPVANGWMDEPYYVAYSGGKDSDVLRILFEMSGVKYDLVHNHTTADAPETVRYVRSIPGIQINYPKESMWQLIPRKKMPPTRVVRYCCEVLKEHGGEGRFVSTGVRWAESANRKKKRGGVEVQHRDVAKKLILNADNDESRMLIESCQLKGKRMLNPIIDWTDDDVWEFLHAEGCKSNPLYECGWKRVGCIGCPLGSKARVREFEMYPKYKTMYIHAFDRMLKVRADAGCDDSTGNWTSAEAVFNWWMK